jgi:hypothetical protein
VPIGGSCGAYVWSGSPNSNGYNTYVPNQAINVHGTGTLEANSPGDWQVTYNLGDCGGCVQVYPDTQQLFNNWGTGGWNGSSDTPISGLATFKIHYSETSPATGASYQFSPDLWGPGPWDIMFWVDTKGRCNEGSFGGQLIGPATFGGQNWTIHTYGDEIIVVLDGPGGSGTCAQQSSGTIDVLAGLEALRGYGLLTGSTLSQVNTGWEVTQSSGQTFRMNSLSYEVVPK